MKHKFNPAKSQVATFGGWRPAVSSIKIYDKPIEWAVSVKYLGCTFRCRTREVDASIFCWQILRFLYQHYVCAWHQERRDDRRTFGQILLSAVATVQLRDLVGSIR